MDNPVMMQFFHWYTPNDGTLWGELERKARSLADAGFTSVWFPPCYKGKSGVDDVGYAAYDLFDLGEFDQMGASRTKYGTRDGLLKAIKAVRDAGMRAHADVVLNHKDGADEEEEMNARRVDCVDGKPVPGDPHPIKAWTHFKYPARQGKYSTMEWHWWHFDAVGYDDKTGDRSHTFLLEGKRFDHNLCGPSGNSDFVLGCDIDHDHDEVRGELFYWGRWFVDTTGFNGFRLDAVKHISCRFYTDWLHHLRTHFGDRDLFAVGEYWSGDLGELRRFLAQCEGVMSLFDVPLHYRFHEASLAGKSYDLRTIFDGTLVRGDPMKAVTFVDNHDSQPCQGLESTVEPWFKPLAYALILLRADGYPCVFYPDYYGAEYENCRGGYPVKMYSHRAILDRFLLARRQYGFGNQRDYFDHPNVVGWTRLGSAEHPGAMAVVLSNGDDGVKRMSTYRPNASFRDITGAFPEKVVTDGEGWADFCCKGGSVSVWVQE
jgi:alpha-amylase